MCARCKVTLKIAQDATDVVVALYNTEAGALDSNFWASPCLPLLRDKCTAANEVWCDKGSEFLDFDKLLFQQVLATAQSALRAGTTSFEEFVVLYSSTEAVEALFKDAVAGKVSEESGDTLAHIGCISQAIEQWVVAADSEHKVEFPSDALDMKAVVEPRICCPWCRRR